ncbi:hypothetical protein CHS0354_004294 [Potamilus streckersoni]|uniref:Uncharacterized protein n=1 Tax=Potamilus streckersoni TaxID=2493646 RepID=A0AAE0VP54_9BIVA|nr:hypothetical protein CHS0354_004294 [Potamilus streckersoni]
MTAGGGHLVDDAQSDFTRLEDSDTDSELSLDERDKKEKDKEMKSKYIEDIKNICGQADGMGKTLHVALVGTYGVGKTSFVNTIAAALSCDRWREHAYAGKYGSEGRPMTVFSENFSKCCKEKDEEYQNIALPTLIDLAGFPDEDNEKWRELLRIVFYGRLQEGESLTSAQEYCEKYGVEGLREKYSTEQEALKVDRVVFVGAADQPVPKNLISCVIEAARPTGKGDDRGRRTIPIYGVLTHADKVDDQEETYESGRKTEKEFVSCLGLEGSRHRYLRCRNYCDDVDHGERMDRCLPELDVPVLRFLKAIFDPELKIQHDDESYSAMKTKSKPVSELSHHVLNEGDSTRVPGRERTRRSKLLVTCIVIAIEAIFVAIFLQWYLASPPVNRGELSDTCIRYNARKDHLGIDFTAFTELCQDLDKLSPKSKIIPFILFVAVRVGTLFLLRFLPAFLND